MEPKWKQELNRDRRAEFEAFLADYCETAKSGAKGPLFDYFNRIAVAYEDSANRRNVEPPVRLSTAKLGRELTVFFRKESTRRGLRYYGLRVKE